MDKQKKAASQALKAYMDRMEVDMNRLKLVEGLAETLKGAGMSNKELEDAIARQKILNQAGISLDTFTAIVEKAKLLTSHDQGKELLQMLSDYGNLVNALKALQAKVQTLNKEADGLEQQAKLKGKIEGDIAKLKAEKAGLEGYVAQLYDEKNALDNIKSEVNSLSEKKATLEHEIAEQEAHHALLTDNIEIKEQTVSDLKELESKRDAMLNSVSAIKAELDKDKVRLDIFESFLGFIESSSLAELEKFVKALPSLLSEVKGGKYSPELMRGVILQQLGGDKLQLLKCTHCQARFAVDKLPKLFGYQCPICGLSHTVKVDEDAAAILKTALSAPKPPQITVMQTVTPVVKQPKPQNDGGA